MSINVSELCVRLGATIGSNTHPPTHTHSYSHSHTHEHVQQCAHLQFLTHTHNNQLTHMLCINIFFLSNTYFLFMTSMYQVAATLMQFRNKRLVDFMKLCKMARVGYYNCNYKTTNPSLIIEKTDANVTVRLILLNGKVEYFSIILNRFSRYSNTLLPSLSPSYI